MAIKKIGQVGLNRIAKFQSIPTGRIKNMFTKVKQSVSSYLLINNKDFLLIDNQNNKLTIVR
jgi:hypothetical protein